MKTHQRPEGKNDEWLTPKHIIDSLGPFDLDPCAPVNRPWDTAHHHYSIEDDGLNLPWEGTVWCNPPFNRYSRPLWMKKAADHGDTILLIPAATETKAFYDYVWERAHGILFIKGRPHFHYVDGSQARANCGTALCLVAYGIGMGIRLSHSDLGKYVKLKQTKPISGLIGTVGDPH